MIDLKKIAEKINLTPNQVVEVGVFEAKESHIKNLIPVAKKVMMFEANKKYYNDIIKEYSKYSYVEVYNVAIFNECKDSVTLYDRGAASFIEGLKAPNVINKGYKEDKKDSFTVEAKTFDLYDDGSIDIITIDIEGAEWYVLEKMKSRPSIICLETHSSLYEWQTYINPHIGDINKWMLDNGYTAHEKDVSDTVFVKNK